MTDLIALAERWHDRFNRVLNEQMARVNREQEATLALDERIQEYNRQEAQRRREAAERPRQRRTARGLRNTTDRPKREKSQPGWKFPPPPIPGNKHIKPITTDRDLLRESEMMNNCVSTYVLHIVKRRSFIYRVHYPQRCTLELTLPECELGEFKAKDNMKPSKASYRYVREWLREQKQQMAAAK